jgi:hypothetical protein
MKKKKSHRWAKGAEKVDEDAGSTREAREKFLHLLDVVLKRLEPVKAVIDTIHRSDHTFTSVLDYWY